MTKTTEQILALSDIMNMSQCYPDREHFARAVEKAAIESYKAELLKEVGEPVAYRFELKAGEYGFTQAKYACNVKYAANPIALFTYDQVAAAVAKADQRIAAEQIANETAEACEAKHGRSLRNDQENI